jgi:hypothetical protein
MMLGPASRQGNGEGGRGTARGVLYVHSAPSALCPHVEGAVGGVLVAPVNASWIPQPAQSGTYRTELSWTGAPGSAAAIASALRGWNHLRFEVTEDPTASTEGARYSYTPELGVFHAVTGVHVVFAGQDETSTWPGPHTGCTRQVTSWVQRIVVPQSSTGRQVAPAAQVFTSISPAAHVGSAAHCVMQAV